MVHLFVLHRSLEDGLIPTPCNVQTHLTTQPTATQRVVCCPPPSHHVGCCACSRGERARSWCSNPGCTMMCNPARLRAMGLNESLCFACGEELRDDRWWCKVCCKSIACRGKTRHKQSTSHQKKAQHARLTRMLTYLAACCARGERGASSLLVCVWRCVWFVHGACGANSERGAHGERVCVWC